MLVTARLLSCLRPGYPYPILALAGEQGTGKSTLSRLRRLLVDPCGEKGTGLSRPPKDDGHLFAIVTTNHVVAFDNVSSISVDLSDSLSALATGAGQGIRRWKPAPAVLPLAPASRAAPDRVRSKSNSRREP